MVKLTMIARVTDGLPLAEGLDAGRDPQDEFYKQQAKSIVKNLSKGQNEPSRMSIETGPYVFQYPDFCCHFLYHKCIQVLPFGRSTIPHLVVFLLFHHLLFLSVFLSLSLLSYYFFVTFFKSFNCWFR